MAWYIYMEPVRREMPESPTEAEIALVGKHFDRLKLLATEGKIFHVGRSSEPPYFGIVIATVKTRAEAEEILNGDPAIEAGMFRGHVQEFYMALPTEGEG